MSQTHCKWCHRLHELCVCRGPVAPKPLHACPKCQAFHRGDFDHCEPCRTEIAKPARVLLIGESNPYGADPGFALYPSPPGCTGDRLCRLILKLGTDEYLERYDRANLCAGKWSRREAQDQVDRLLMPGTYRGVVLLGRKVASAFGARLCGKHVPEPWSTGLVAVPGFRFVCLPHPSGLCREWGKPGAFERARQLLVDAGMV